MKNVRFALVGCGGFGEHISMVLKKLSAARIVAVCDPDTGRAKRLADMHQAEAYGDTATLYRDGEFEAVLIVTPNDMHCLNTVEAVGAGKHVFCEKPMALNTAECVRMAVAARTAGVCLMVGHKRRLRPTHRYMDELVKDGTLGSPVAMIVSAVWGQGTIPGWWADQTRSGGMLAWNGVHDLDFMRSICGEVARVRARQSGKSHVGHDYPDMVFVELEFSSGAIGTYEGGFYYPLVTEHESNSVRIICERGAVGFEGSTLTVRHQSQGSDPQSEVFAEFGFESAYRLELSSFIDWVVDRKPPVVSWVDGLRCVEIMDAAYVSLRTGGWVDLPLPEHRGLDEAL